MNQKLKYLGYNAAYELTQAVSLRAAGKMRDDDDED
jgi:hypothetical protein